MFEKYAVLQPVALGLHVAKGAADENADGFPGGGHVTPYPSTAVENNYTIDDSVAHLGGNDPSYSSLRIRRVTGTPRYQMDVRM